MSGEVVADTSPLIALARIGELDLLRRLYGRVAVPAAVEAELAIGSDRPGARMLEAALVAGWLSVQPVSDRAPGPDLSLLLGPGEAEAIVLAEERQARLLLIDDLQEDGGLPVGAVSRWPESPAYCWRRSPVGRSLPSAPSCEGSRKPGIDCLRGSLPRCSRRLARSSAQSSSPLRLQMPLPLAAM